VFWGVFHFANGFGGGGGPGGAGFFPRFVARKIPKFGAKAHRGGKGGGNPMGNRGRLIGGPGQGFLEKRDFFFNFRGFGSTANFFLRFFRLLPRGWFLLRGRALGPFLKPLRAPQGAGIISLAGLGGRGGAGFPPYFRLGPFQNFTHPVPFPWVFPAALGRFSWGDFPPGGPWPRRFHWGGPFGHPEVYVLPPGRFARGRGPPGARGGGAPGAGPGARLISAPRRLISRDDSGKLPALISSSFPPARGEGQGPRGPPGGKATFTFRPWALLGGGKRAGAPQPFRFAGPFFRPRKP